MANYGFAIDLRKCIGCHACTIACKAEHDIPIGVNRCWVKTVEKGTFPDTRRFFFPVLCNQCDAAPCVRICPTRALFKRRDGIVDLNGNACIGCRACMQACPYDQLFIDPNTRTAEKCNFCANRVENHLLPSCVVVCPTECRVFGDLDDPASAVSRVVRDLPVTVRKPEKGTAPKVFYVAAEESAIRPEIAARPLIFKEGEVRLRPLGAVSEEEAAAGHPRVDYDVPHERPWGIDMALYLLTKGIATGALLVAALLWWAGFDDPLTRVVAPGVALAFITATAIILIADLDRPERFYYILTRPNWSSWVARGAFLLAAFGIVAAAWLTAGIAGPPGAIAALLPIAVVVGLAGTVYTAFLFAQGSARDLWQGPHASVDLIAQALVEGAAVLMFAAPFVSQDEAVLDVLASTALLGLALHLGLLAFEHLTPSPTEHHRLALAAVHRGAFAKIYWAAAVVPAAVAAVLLLAGARAGLTIAAGALALISAFAWEYIWVHAAQEVPNS